MPLLDLHPPNHRPPTAQQERMLISWSGAQPLPGKTCVLCPRLSTGVGEHVIPSWYQGEFLGDDVPATNNGSENAVRGYKLAAKISGCWRTLSTPQRHCRARSYLTTARSHGRHPLAAIYDALTGNTWMPPHPA
jgi:hypothetical protein